MRKFLALAAAMFAFAVCTSPASAASVELVDQPFVCNGPVDLDLVRVTMNTRNADAVSLRNCFGRIGRLEVITNTQDGVKAQNGAGSFPHDLVVEGGFVRCDGVYPGAHQDGVQIMGGINLEFRNLSVDCPLSNANFFVARGGAGASTPTNVLCISCQLFEGAAHTILLGTSQDSGAMNSKICADDTFSQGIAFDIVGATNPVDVSNLKLQPGDPLCL